MSKFKYLVALALVAAVAAVSFVVGVSRISHPAQTTSFVLYDGTFYRNVALGLPKSNVVYGTAHLPTEEAFKTAVQAADRHPEGPLVLDYESFYLTGSPETAQEHFKALSTLLRWAHQDAPGQVVGFYGLLGHTSPQYYPLARELSASEDAFFPTLYTFNDDRGSWSALLAADAAQAKAVNAKLPVYPFIWAQYHDGTPQAYQYLTADHLSYELSQIKAVCSGAVLWSQAVNASSGWESALS